MRGSHLAVVLLVFGLAGCTGPQVAGPLTQSHDEEAARVSVAGAHAEPLINGTQEETAYRFYGTVTGTNPPALGSQRGRAVDELPVAKEETFEAPANTRGLSFEARGGWQGIGRSRIEVLGPDGAYVYGSDTWEAVTIGGASAGSIAFDEWGGGPAGPGTYTVHYHVGGSVDLGLVVTAWVDKGVAGNSTASPGAAT